MDLREKGLNDDFELFANWWLPGSSANRLPGILEFSQESGATLKLQGVFDHPSFGLDNVLQGTLPIFETIFGEQPNGDCITLRRVFCRKLSGKNNTSDFFCQLILGGRHVDSGVPSQPVSAFLEFDNLESWSCFRLTSSINGDSYCFPMGPVDLWSVPETRFHPKITLAATVSHELAQARAVFERRAWITFEREGLTIEEILELANQTAQLLTILMGRPTSLRRCVYVVGEGAGTNLFFQRARITSQGEIHGHDMSFNLMALGDRVGSLFSNWFESIAELRPVYSVFFSTLFNEASYVDVTFQSFVQALEGFHRKTREGNYLSKDEFEGVRDTLVRAIPATVDRSLRDKLEASIRYGNEYSLRRRLEELLDYVGRSTVEMIKINSSFVSDVVKTRNYYAHLDESLRTRFVGNGPDMYRLNQQLQALFTILVAIRLGIPEEDAARQITAKMHLDAH
jgi:hypothetical protein